MFGVNGMPELIIVSVIALTVFGPAKFSVCGKSLGAAIRGLRQAVPDFGDCAVARSGRRPTPLNQGFRL